MTVVLLLEGDGGGTQGWEGTKAVRAEQRSAELWDLAMSMPPREGEKALRQEDAWQDQGTATWSLHTDWSE